MTNLEKIYLFLISVIFALIFSDGFFFGDNVVQLAVPANYYFDNNFAHYFIPDEIATGHQTFSAYYFAIGWKIFGRSLLVSHLLLVPFIYGILVQFFRLISKFILNKNDVYLVFFLIVLQSGVIAQLSLLTFEIFHIFFFLWSINAFLEKKNGQLSVAFAGLCLISLRSTMSGIGVFLFANIYLLWVEKKFNLSRLLPFLSGFLLFGLFLLTFYLEKNWIVHNTVSKNWEQSGETASIKEMLRNAVIVAKTFADFGAFFILGGSAVMFYFFFKNKKLQDYQKILLSIFITQLLIFVVVLVPSRNFISNRYLLPAFIPLSLLFYIWVVRENIYRNAILLLSLIGTINGWFWDYPDKIATSWDSSPTHWNYYSLRVQMKNYIKSKGISPDEVGTFFPNGATFKNMDLENSDEEYRDGDLKRDKYLFFSNIFNASDEVIDELADTKKWKAIKTFQQGNVFVTLYERRK